MTDLIPYNSNSVDVEMKGRVLYQTNTFFKSLANVMENPEFRGFLSEYVKDWSDFKTVVLYIKLYEMIEAKGDFTGYQKLAILQSIFTDKSLRKEAVKRLIDFTDNKDTAILKSELL